MATTAPWFEYLLESARLAYQAGYRVSNDQSGDMSERDTARMVARLLSAGCDHYHIPIPESIEELHAVTDSLHKEFSHPSTGRHRVQWDAVGSREGSGAMGAEGAGTGGTEPEAGNDNRGDQHEFPEASDGVPV